MPLNLLVKVKTRGILWECTTYISGTGRAIGKGIYFPNIGIKNGINFHNFGIRNNGTKFQDFAMKYKVGYTFSKIGISVGTLFPKIGIRNRYVSLEPRWHFSDQI